MMPSSALQNYHCHYFFFFFLFNSKLFFPPSSCRGLGRPPGRSEGWVPHRPSLPLTRSRDTAVLPPPLSSAVGPGCPSQTPTRFPPRALAGQRVLWWWLRGGPSPRGAVRAGPHRSIARRPPAVPGVSWGAEAPRGPGGLAKAFP